MIRGMSKTLAHQGKFCLGSQHPDSNLVLGSALCCNVASLDGCNRKTGVI